MYMYRVFGPHPYVQKDFSGNRIKICNRCFDQWILHRKEASLKEMRLFEDELNEEICCLCSDCPEADLILCESCPRSFCVDCLKKVLTAEVCRLLHSSIYLCIYLCLRSSEVFIIIYFDIIVIFVCIYIYIYMYIYTYV